MRILLPLLLILAPLLPAQEDVRVASKSFNESVILGEILKQLAEDAGANADHNEGMGGTGLVFSAIKAGEIDAYVDYVGTVMFDTYSTDGPQSLEELRRLLERDGLRMSAPLGFNNTYAIGMLESVAEEHGLTKISDLADHPDLELGFSNEFVEREDGWVGLKREYGLPHNAGGLEHALAYKALESGQIDVTDLYSTDAEVEQYDLRVLEDDLGFFPDYSAVIIYRADLAERAPFVIESWRRMLGRINEPLMISMNASVKIDGQEPGVVAHRFVQDVLPRLEGGEEVRQVESSAVGVSDRVARAFQRLPGWTLQHLGLVGASLIVAILLALPLGIIAHRRPRFGQVILGATGILQTIPSLALLVLLIPLVGIGWWPAALALFLYSLLPIVRNTHAGLSGIDAELIESADALGLENFARLKLIELPLAGRSILAGIKIAAVINVGTATLGGFIDAGGYGQPIMEGIRLDDNVLILFGAVPAALLALAVQGTFEVAERLVVPRGLRLKRG